MELFLDKSGLVVNKRLALDMERSEHQLYVAMSRIQGNFISTLLVLDVEKPQCLELYVVCTSCMHQCPEYKESTWLVSDVERPQCVSCMQP